MYIETVIEMILVFLAYFAVIIMFPAFMLKPIVRKKTITERFMIYLVTGNMLIMYLVFFLAYLHILYRSVLILLLLFIGIGVRILLEKKKKTFDSTNIKKEISYLFAGEYGIRLYIRRKSGLLFGKIKNWGRELFYHKLIEWFFFLVVTIYYIWYYGHHTMKYVSFGAYDEEVHLYWVQSMLAGKIFPSGMYPHGFHNVLGTISLIFNIEAVNVVRVMGVVSTTFIMTMLYLGMRKICTFKYAAVFGFFVFPFLNMYRPDAFNRYQYAIPQEYGMIFLIPMVLFLFAFLKEKKKWDLVLFGLSFSLTLLTHFYVTIIAGLLCVSIGMVYIVRIIKEKLLLKLFITGIIAVAAALLPIGIGFAMGYQFEQSMGWAAGVIKGEENKNSQSIEQEDKNKNSIITDKKEEIPNTYYEQFKKEAKRILEKYVFNYVEWMFLLIAIFSILIFYTLVLGLLRKIQEENLYQFCFVVYGLVLVLMLLCRALKLPSIMEEKRVGIFLAYCTPLYFAFPFEVLYQVVRKIPFVPKLYSVVMVIITAVCGFYVSNSNLARTFQPFYYFQPSGTMKAILRIMDTYKDHTWTVVSSVNENSVVMNQGYHYELSDFIIQQENWNHRMQIRIPTKYVFVIIEKIPNQFFGFWLYDNDERFKLENRIAVSEEYGRKSISMDLDSDENYTKYRIELMSKAYYWAQEYEKYFKDEMNVYYEDEEVVVYRIEQNEYYLNNFAIDYNLNNE